MTKVVDESKTFLNFVAVQLQFSRKSQKGIALEAGVFEVLRLFQSLLLSTISDSFHIVNTAERLP